MLFLSEESGGFAESDITALNSEDILYTETDPRPVSSWLKHILLLTSSTAVILLHLRSVGVQTLLLLVLH